MMEPLADGSLILNIVLLVVSLVICALFSFIETSITALRLFKLKELAQQTTGRYQALFKSLEESPHRVLITILIANNLADVTAATVSTQLLEHLFADLPGSIGFPISIGITTFVLLIFGEILPKNIAKIHGEKLFKSTLWITNISFYALYPLVNFLGKMSDYFIRKIGNTQTTEGSEYVTSEREVQFLIDYIDEKGLIEKDKTSMLKSIFKLGTTPAKEIMIPATSIISISIETTPEQALEIFKKYQYSRFPVYDGNLDNVIGMLHQKDLFTALFHHEKIALVDILRPILFIPETLKVNQLLREFKVKHMHIAIVIDEHGGIEGLVTLEDVLEEIVGEIRDEYEIVTEKFTPIKPNSWMVDGSIELKKLDERLSIRFHTEEAMTLAGFLIEQFQYIPEKGEEITYKGYQFKIHQATPKRIFQVLITKIETFTEENI